MFRHKGHCEVKLLVLLVLVFVLVAVNIHEIGCIKRKVIFKHILIRPVYNIMLLIKLFRIGPVTGPRLAVLDRGRRPRSNTADRGPVTGPIRNDLINEIFIN